MKYKRGERIHLIYDEYNGAPPEEYVMGHVTEAEARAAMAEWGGPCLGDGVASVKHIYGRLVFAHADSSYDRELRTYESPQRGAFALTMVEFDTLEQAFAKDTTNE